MTFLWKPGTKELRYRLWGNSAHYSASIYVFKVNNGNRTMCGSCGRLFCYHRDIVRLSLLPNLEVFIRETFCPHWFAVPQTVYRAILQKYLN